MEVYKMARIFLLCLTATLVQSCTQEDSPQNDTVCKEMPMVFDNGLITCTNDNKVGSNCTFNCTSPGYHLNPSETLTSECMATGQWSSEMPCCAKMCPPFAPLELVWLFNRKDDVQTVWNAFGESFSGLWKVDPQYIRTSRILYSGIVHPELSLYFDIPQPEGWRSLALRKLYPPTDIKTLCNEADGLTNTGNALRHVGDHVFNDEHKHNSLFPVVEVVVVVTDKNSNDNVSVAAENLRSVGVQTYAVFLDYDNTTDVNMEQLIAIGGQSDHVIVVENNTKQTGQKKAKELVALLCQNICGP